MIHFLAESAKKIGLGAIDRTLGFIFGLLRGILILGLFFMPFYNLAPKETLDTYMEGSQTRLYLEKTAAALTQLIPDSMSENMEKSAEGLEETLGTREKLEEINLLKQSGSSSSDDTNAAPRNEPGYNEDFRQKMDQLFEEKTQ